MSNDDRSRDRVRARSDNNYYAVRTAHERRAYY